MTNSWQTVPLRQVLKLDLTKVPLDAGTDYPMVGVYSFGRGLFIREPVSGNNTSYKFYYQLKAEHVVISSAFGWEGALALSSEKFEGLFLSPQFPTFLCDESQLDREFLGWVMRRKSFWEDLGSRTKGMGDRRQNVLNPEALFTTEIPLPPLTEQRRIVAHIELLAARVHEAQRLREDATQETKSIIASKSFGSFSPHVTSGPRYWRDRYSKGGFRFYRAQDIGPHGNILHYNKAYVTPPEVLTKVKLPCFRLAI